MLPYLQHTSSGPRIILQICQNTLVEAASFSSINFYLAAPICSAGSRDLEQAESVLGCRFPTDYRDFIIEFGSGEFDKMPMRAEPPRCISLNTEADRSRLREYWFWDNSPDVWSQQLAVESVMCFGSWNGDDIRFHPSDPETYYILPHGEDVIYRLRSFDELVTHFCTHRPYTKSGLIFRPHKPEELARIK